MSFFTTILPFIVKYRQYFILLLILLGIGVVYFYISHLQFTIIDLERENSVLKTNISQYQSEIDAKYKTITGINHILQECYKIQQMQQEDLSEIESIMRLQDDTPTPKSTKVTNNEISQKTYAAGIKFINEQLSSIK